MSIRYRLTTRQRANLYTQEVQKARDAGRGNLPICNICDLQIVPPSRWHESHNPYLPHALGGASDGVAHDRCNLRHAWRHDMPLIAKNKRIKEKFEDMHRPRQSFPGGKESDRYRKVSGEVVFRVNGERA